MLTSFSLRSMLTCVRCDAIASCAVLAQERTDEVHDVPTAALASISPPHVGSGSATDEENDGEEEERESLPVVGTSRPPRSPGPIPLSRAARLLIEVSPCSAAGMALHRVPLPP
jgi:hypothetical protein